MPVEALAEREPVRIEDRRKRLFDTYIKRMFERRGKADKPYSDDQTRDWLSGLAQKMLQNSKTVFLIEELQPDWLPTLRQIWFYGLGSRFNVGLIFGLIMGLIFGLREGLSSGLHFVLTIGLIAGLLVYGGLDVIKHYTLRLILWWKGCAPLNSIKFLDYATKLIFLRKVGGGYIFIHRMLMEHFAAMGKDESGPQITQSE